LLLAPDDLDRDVAAGQPRPARQPDPREVVDVAQVLALLVAVRRQVLGAGDDLDPAQPAGALADARGVDPGRELRAGLEQRRPGRNLNGDRLAVTLDGHPRQSSHPTRPAAIRRADAD